MGNISKIFITHTHGDHIFGLGPLLASRLNGAGGMVAGVHDPREQELVAQDQPVVEIYGPSGTRAYVRSALVYSHTLLGAPYVVHELHDAREPLLPESNLPLNASELPHGQDMPIDAESNTWPIICKDALVQVSAAPIHHSVPCVGFVVSELPVPGKMDPALYIPHLKRTKSPMSLLSRLQGGETVELSDGTVLTGPGRRPGRKIVILGDTHDPSPIADLALDCDILVHEATNAHLPDVDSNTKSTDTHESVEERTKSRGHSTPQMAGKFATRVKARKLVLNHFSARYAGDEDVNEESRNIMGAIKSLAESEYLGGEVLCARDLWGFDIPISSS